VGHVENPTDTAALDAALFDVFQPAWPLSLANAFGNLMWRDVKAKIAASSTAAAMASAMLRRW
jgi:hypothetical protein